MSFLRRRGAWFAQLPQLPAHAPDLVVQEVDKIPVLDTGVVEVGVCKGKKVHDKRSDMKKRDAEREIRRDPAPDGGAVSDQLK